MTKLPIRAALAAAFLAQPATAQPASAPRTTVVAHADLDLATHKGVKTLDRRIWRAVVAVCGTAPDYDLAGRNDVRSSEERRGGTEWVSTCRSRGWQYHKKKKKTNQ